MSEAGGNVVDLGPPPRPGRPRGLPNGVLGMALFVGVEIMLFAGFISAFTIVKASFAPGTWPPPGSTAVTGRGHGVYNAAVAGQWGGALGVGPARAT